MTLVFYIKRRPRCRVEGCRRRDIQAFGYCNPHYQRYYRTGDPLPRWQSREERILSHVDRSGGPDACWPWTGRKTGYGYGCFGKPPRGAHRLVYSILTGRQIQFTLDHECHNLDPSCPGGECPHRLCCNPAHLIDRRLEINASRAASTRATCKRGHPWTKANTSWVIDKRDGKRYRRCRACHRARQAAYEERLCS